jgi:hypothetical protein
MCNNLIFNEFIVLNASYVCLLHSHFIENRPIWILEDGPLISEAVVLGPVACVELPSKVFTSRAR